MLLFCTIIFPLRVQLLIMEATAIRTIITITPKLTDIATTRSVTEILVIAH
jgi:hypothetical protein